MVSTESEEIAKIAMQYGAEVPFLRSKKNADDFATTVDVINEVLEEYKKIGKNITHVCCLYPTSPFATAERIIEGFKLLSQYDSVVPVTAFSYPVWRAFKITEAQKLQYEWPEYEQARSQDLRQLYHDAGQWYWIKVEKLESSLITSNTGHILLDGIEVQDIDSLSDWKVAEWKYEYLQNLK